MKTPTQLAEEIRLFLSNPRMEISTRSEMPKEYDQSLSKLNQEFMTDYWETGSWSKDGFSVTSGSEVDTGSASGFKGVKVTIDLKKFLGKYKKLDPKTTDAKALKKVGDNITEYMFLLSDDGVYGGISSSKVSGTKYSASLGTYTQAY